MLNESDHEAEDAAPIDMLEAYYDAHGWENERHDEEPGEDAEGAHHRAPTTRYQEKIAATPISMTKA